MLGMQPSDVSRRETHHRQPQSLKPCSVLTTAAVRNLVLIPSTFRDSTVPPPQDRSSSDPAQYHFKIYQVPGYLYIQPRTRIQKSK